VRVRLLLDAAGEQEDRGERPIRIACGCAHRAARPRRPGRG
jgi:hypothetical protein